MNSLVYKYETDISQILHEHFQDFIKLHVRKGKDEMYLESFKLWYQKLLEKGVDKMIGNHGGWDAHWAKGIMIYTDELDSEYLENRIVFPIELENNPCHYTEDPENDVYFIVYLHKNLFDQLSKRTK